MSTLFTATHDGAYRAPTIPTAAPEASSSFSHPSPQPSYSRPTTPRPFQANGKRRRPSRPKYSPPKSGGGGYDPFDFQKKLTTRYKNG